MNWGKQEGRPWWRQPQEERCFPRITIWPAPECLLPGEEPCSPQPSLRELNTLTSPSHPQGTPETCDSRTRAMASWLGQTQDFASQEGIGTPQPPPKLAGKRAPSNHVRLGASQGWSRTLPFITKHPLSIPTSLPLPASSPQKSWGWELSKALELALEPAIPSPSSSRQHCQACPQEGLCGAFLE